MLKGLELIRDWKKHIQLDGIRSKTQARCNDLGPWQVHINLTDQNYKTLNHEEGIGGGMLNIKFLDEMQQLGNKIQANDINILKKMQG